METEDLITEELDGDEVARLRAESIAIVRDLVLKGNLDVVRIWSAGRRWRS